MMHVLAIGTLVADPVRRTGTKGDFATASVRVTTDDGVILASAIAFGDRAQELLAHRQGATIAVAGRAKLTAWIGRDGADKHGISVTIDQIASASAARRADTDRHRRAPA